MKKHMKRILGIILMIAAVSTVSYTLQDLGLYREDGDSFRIKAFYREPADSLDVVVMGSSEVMCGFMPPELYRMAGLTGYSYSFPVNPVQIWKYELRDIERTQHPQLLVIETNGALYTEEKYIHSNYCVETLADNMPLSANRLELIHDWAKHPLERLFPILKYHYKWPRLRKLGSNRNLMLRKAGHAKLRGARSELYRREKPAEKLITPDAASADLSEASKAELEDFLEEAKKSGIENILFVEFPHLIDDKDRLERHHRANRAAEMIRDAGFEYASFMDKMDEMGMDPGTDFTDSEHMLAPGQKKLSIYLAKFIDEKYGLEPKQQTEKNRAGWEESAELADCYYRFYDEYTQAHKDEQYRKAEFVMGDNVRTIKELEKIRQGLEKH